MMKIDPKFLKDIFLILITFVLTTFVGGYFQERSWKQQQDDTLLREERERAENTFSEISSSMDERLYQMKYMLKAYKGGDKKNQDDAWVLYKNALFGWNKNMNKYFALLNRYFGENYSSYYRKEIFGAFEYWDYKIQLLREEDNLESRDLQELDDGLAVLSNIIYKYDLHLLNAMKSGNVGVFAKKDNGQRTGGVLR